MSADLDLPPSVAEEKRRLRRRMRALRLVADQKEGPDAALALCRTGLAHLDTLGISAGRVVAGYWPIVTEVDVRPLLARMEERGVRCALPAIVPASDVLLFRRWRPVDELEEGGHETRQPPASAEVVVPDVLLVPLLAVDQRGSRLGQGRGWYDRTLAALRLTGRPVAVGVGFAVQVIARVPCSPEDQPVDFILTGGGLLAAGLSATGLSALGPPTTGQPAAGRQS